MRLLTLAAAATCGLALTAFALPRLSDSAPKADDEETPLMTEMNKISDALRDLRRSYRKVETHKDALASLVICQEASLKSKVLDPAMLAKLPAERQEAFRKAYRIEMIKFEKALLDFELGILEGKDSDALKELYTAVKNLEEPGHERFTEGG